MSGQTTIATANAIETTPLSPSSQRSFVTCAADPRLLARCLGPPGRAGDADDPIASAEHEGDLGCLGRQADDAAREVDPALAVHLRSRERVEAARPPRIR